MNVRVRVVDKVEKRDYTDEGQVQRMRFAGYAGHIVAQHDSHGLCYDVQFQDGMATYDPDELRLV